jgi:hypothetical protein
MGQMHSMFWLMNNTNTTWWAASTQIILVFLLPKFSERINIFMLKIQSRQPDLNHALSNKVSKIKISLTENTAKKIVQNSVI